MRLKELDVTHRESERTITDLDEILTAAQDMKHLAAAFDDKIARQMYFVVTMSSSGTNSKIYYETLLPLRIRRILQGANSGQQKISVDFKRFPDDVETITAIMESFWAGKEKQAYVATVNLSELLSIEKLQESSELHAITMTTASVHDCRKDPIDALLQDDIYIYANATSADLTIPIDMIDGDAEKIVYYPVDNPVSIQGVVYYDGYRVVRTATETKIQIGESVTLIRQASHGKKAIINYTTCTSLRQRCKDLAFWIAFVETKCLEFGEKSFPYDTNWGEFGFSLQKGREQLEYCQNLVRVLDILGIKSDINLMDMSERDQREFTTLINSLVKKQLVGPLRSDLPLN